MPIFLVLSRITKQIINMSEYPFYYIKVGFDEGLNYIGVLASCFSCNPSL